MPWKNGNPPLYGVWLGMRRRCLTPTAKQWSDYGGRGISICPAWDSFKQFVSDMGPRPGPEYSIDRIDNDGNYEPGNCRWATNKQQQRNQRTTRRVSVDGETYLVAELVERSGVKHDTIIDRAKRGLSLDGVLSKQRFRTHRVPIEAVTKRVSNQAARTHCKRGHEFTPENTYSPKPGQRLCRACHNAKMRARNAAKPRL